MSDPAPPSPAATMKSCSEYDFILTLPTRSKAEIIKSDDSPTCNLKVTPARCRGQCEGSSCELPYRLKVPEIVIESIEVDDDTTILQIKPISKNGAPKDSAPSSPSTPNGPPIKVVEIKIHGCSGASKFKSAHALGSEQLDGLAPSLPLNPEFSGSLDCPDCIEAYTTAPVSRAASSDSEATVPNDGLSLASFLPISTDLSISQTATSYIKQLLEPITEASTEPGSAHSLTQVPSEYFEQPNPGNPTEEMATEMKREDSQESVSTAGATRGSDSISEGSSNSSTSSIVGEAKKENETVHVPVLGYQRRRRTFLRDLAANPGAAFAPNN